MYSLVKSSRAATLLSIINCHFIRCLGNPLKQLIHSFVIWNLFKWASFFSLPLFFCAFNRQWNSTRTISCTRSCSKWFITVSSLRFRFGRRPAILGKCLFYNFLLDLNSCCFLNPEQVKWYKNNLEFYRYLIKQNQILPEHKVFPQLGIHIAVSFVCKLSLFIWDFFFVNLQLR